jgi:hypothetical protein
MKRVQDPEVSISPLKPRMDVDHQKQIPPSVHQHKPVAPPVPSLLRGRYDSHEKPFPVEHRTHADVQSGQGVQPFGAQEEFPHFGDKASEAFGSNAICDLHFSLGSPVNSARHGILHNGDTDFYARDGFGIHRSIGRDAPIGRYF